jgi:hypothetical protein
MTSRLTEFRLTGELTTDQAEDLLKRLIAAWAEVSVEPADIEVGPRKKLPPEHFAVTA